MTGWEALLAAFAGGLLTSGSPCVLAAVPVAIGYVGGQARTPMRAWTLSFAFVAGLTFILVLLGLFAARFGMLMGTLPGPWSVAVGTVVIAAGVYMWFAAPTTEWQVPAAWRERLNGAGVWGAFVLGALISTVMSPCATPVLAAALAVAGAGAAFGESMWWGAALLLAYAVGHGVLLFVAGGLPSGAGALLAHSRRVEAWLPGRRFFSALLVLAGLWWVLAGLQLAAL